LKFNHWFKVTGLTADRALKSPKRCQLKTPHNLLRGVFFGCGDASICAATTAKSPIYFLALTWPW
jgi:hypothetical protein